MSVLAQAILFLSSYSPLLGVFALLDTFGAGAPSIVCTVLAGLGLTLLPILFVDRKAAPQALKIKSARPRDGDVLAYVASYLVPFASVSASTTRQQVAVGIFIALIAVLYVRTQLFYVNPILALVGYRIYEVDTPGGTPLMLICRRRFIPPETTLPAIRISDYVWREKPS